MNEHTISGTCTEMMEPGFWIEKLDDADDIIMNNDEIRAFNEKILGTGVVYDLKGYKVSLNRDELLELVERYKIPGETRYDIEGKEVTEEFYSRIVANTNIKGIKDKNPVRYGIAVRSTSVRRFPTDTGVYKTDDDKEFDRFQETGCQAVEPVLVLHESSDGEWYFAVIYNYIGWIRKQDVALGSREDIFNYLDTDNFIVVTGNRVRTQFNPYEPRVSTQEFQMGTRVPIETNAPQNVGNQSTVGNFCLRLPVREDDGSLSFRPGLISKTQDITVGYLKYTRSNIIRQVFKLQGDRYGWGDSFNGRDCSSTVMYTYKTFGVRLPRNGSDQEKVPGRPYKFEENSSTERRCSLFDNVKPGAAIYMDGHTMMYLGKISGEPFMIHNFYKYGIMDGEVLRAVPANEVAVTSTLLLNSSGRPFIEVFTSLVQFE